MTRAAFPDKLAAVVQHIAAEGRPRTQALVDAVIRAGAVSEQSLVALLQDRGGAARLRADIAWLVPRLQIADAHAVLEPMLDDPAEDVRRASAEALGVVAHDGSVDALLRVIERDPSRAVRFAAIHALGLFSAPRATPTLSRVLHDPAEDGELRAVAAESLAHCASEAAVDTLIAALDDADAEVRYSAAYALGEQGNPRATPRLAESAAHDRAVTRWGAVAARAAEAIAAIRARGAAESE